MKEMIKSRTTKRVSDEAAKELNNDLENHGYDIGLKAKEYAEKDGRKTVRGEDIRKAIKEKEE